MRWQMFLLIILGPKFHLLSKEMTPFSTGVREAPIEMFNTVLEAQVGVLEIIHHLRGNHLLMQNLSDDPRDQV